MSSVLLHHGLRRWVATHIGVWRTFWPLLAMFVAALLAGMLPIAVTIASVFLFAGPHNWLEARYLLSRMPARWGKLRPFFFTAVVGVVALTIAFITLGWGGRAWELSTERLAIGYGLWSSGLVLWLCLLARLRARRAPRRHWPWIWPLAAVAWAMIWYEPHYWMLGITYLHPLLALWILDRELQTKPAWRMAFRRCLACLPLVLLLLWWHLAKSPNLSGQDWVTGQIIRQAGGGLLKDVSTHLLVATHTFLELLHYGVWIVALPLLGLGIEPWRIDKKLPLAQRSTTWRRGLSGFMIVGACLALLLWCCFLADYALTRDIYFTLSVFHVLAEMPFLLWLL